MQPLAESLGRAGSKRRLDTTFREGAGAVFMYARGALNPALEDRLIRYAEEGGQLIVRDHPGNLVRKRFGVPYGHVSEPYRRRRVSETLISRRPLNRNSGWSQVREAVEYVVTWGLEHRTLESKPRMLATSSGRSRPWEQLAPVLTEATRSPEATVWS